MKCPKINMSSTSVLLLQSLREVKVDSTSSNANCNKYDPRRIYSTACYTRQRFADGSVALVKSTSSKTTFPSQQTPANLCNSSLFPETISQSLTRTSLLKIAGERNCHDKVKTVRTELLGSECVNDCNFPVIL